MTGSIDKPDPISIALEQTTELTIEFCAKIADLYGEIGDPNPEYRKACLDIAASLRKQKGTGS